jgi:hypothetical protein
MRAIIGRGTLALSWLVAQIYLDHDFENISTWR